MSQKNWEKPEINHNQLTKWNWTVAYPHKLKLGDNVDIGAFTYINAKCFVDIEDDVQIGGGCHIYSDNTIDGTCGPVLLKKGCKIGAHSVILPNVVVGRNSTIGAFSLAKSYIPDNVLAYGVPARIIKKI